MTRELAEEALAKAGAASDEDFPLFEASLACALHEAPDRDADHVRALAAEAAERLAASKPARALFGDEFVEHYAATRQWEEREFRKAITDWELARYFEII